MLKRVLCVASLMLALVSCASTPAAPVGARAGAAAASKVPPPGCVDGTATLLPAKANECAGFGSVYTKEQMDRTGQTTAPDALRLLDPTLTIHGH